MLNFQRIITNVLKESYEELCPNVHVNPDVLHVKYFGKKNIDYAFYGLSKLGNLLENFSNLLMQKMREKKGLFEITCDNNFMNFNVKDNVLHEVIKNIMAFDLFGFNDNKKKILVDFSSPNIAKELHVGHLRSTIIGESICRFFEMQNNEVLRVNHIGDYGTQFGMLLEYIRKFDVEVTSISGLQDCYVKSKKLFDSDEEFNKNAHDQVIKLQNGEHNDIWMKIKEISRNSYQDIYERLDVHLEEFGESFYGSMIPNMINELMQKNLLEDYEGMKIIRFENNNKNKKLPLEQQDHILIIVKSDGGYTYDTTDLAAIRYRLIDLQVDDIYYVIDKGQSLHCELLFHVAKMAGWLTTQKVKHIDFGLVLNEKNERIKSRDGGTIRLVDLLDNGLDIAREFMTNNSRVLGKFNNFNKDMQDDIIETITYDSVKYADLMNVRTGNYKFSYDKMMKLNGNTSVYLLYVYVRIHSLLDKAKKHDKNIEKIVLHDKLNNFDATDEYSLNLMRHLMRFQEMICEVNNNLMFHTMCNYTFELCQSFTIFYKNNSCMIYDENKNIIDMNYNNLILCYATKKILDECFYILNIKPLYKM